MLNISHLSPISTFGAVGQSMPQSASMHMAPSQPYPSPTWESAVVPKYHKISFETYDGKEDPLGWLNKCEQFLRGQLTREADKVWMASYHLKGSPNSGTSFSSKILAGRRGPTSAATPSNVLGRPSAPTTSPTWLAYCSAALWTTLHAPEGTLVHRWVTGAHPHRLELLEPQDL
jgi:hypothetical protein